METSTPLSSTDLIYCTVQLISQYQTYLIWIVYIINTQMLSISTATSAQYILSSEPFPSIGICQLDSNMYKVEDKLKQYSSNLVLLWE